jgi:hypothetical protein
MQGILIFVSAKQIYMLSQTYRQPRTQGPVFKGSGARGGTLANSDCQVTK